MDNFYLDNVDGKFMWVYKASCRKPPEKTNGTSCSEVFSGFYNLQARYDREVLGRYFNDTRDSMGYYSYLPTGYFSGNSEGWSSDGIKDNERHVLAQKYSD